MTSGTAIYTTVFPNALPFLDDFGTSLASQTDREFDLWVGLDRLEVSDVRDQLPRGRSVTWVSQRDGDTYASVRQRAWEQMVDAYDFVILVDPDDVLHPERVACARAGIAGCDVYGCALELIDVNGSPLGARLTAGEMSDWPRLLAARNVFGLSNTAYRSSVLRNCLPLPVSLGLIDWHLASRALAQSATLAFDSRPLMLYRQYAASTARIVPPFSVEDLRSATRLVLRHYEEVFPYLAAGPAFAERVRRRWHEVIAFSRLADDSLNEYVDTLNQRQQPVYSWWEVVAAEEMKALWTR